MPIASLSKAKRLAQSAGAMLTLDDIAERMNVSRRTVHRLIENGQFPAADMRLSKRLQRWRPSTVEKAISKLGN